MAKFSIDKNYTATFNNATKEATKKSPFSLIPFDKIEANVENFYSIEDIDNLKYAIKTVGLQEPPIVLPKNEDGKYVLISGERRWTAISQLIAEGDKSFEQIYVKILNPDDLDVPLSYEEKVRYLIVSANAHRNNTNEDILNEMKTLRNIYTRLKENGAEVSLNLRPFIAESLGMSETQVQRYSSIEKHLMYEFFDMFCKDILPISVADSISKLNPIMQREFYERVKNQQSITQPMLDEFIESKQKATTKTVSAIIPNKKSLSAAKKAAKTVTKYLNAPIPIENETQKAQIDDLLNQLTTDLNKFIMALSGK